MCPAPRSASGAPALGRFGILRRKTVAQNAPLGSIAANLEAVSGIGELQGQGGCLLYTSPSPRD
eukprot:9481601-Alexandrium_andersonii.AAC.1